MLHNFKPILYFFYTILFLIPYTSFWNLIPVENVR